MVETTGDYPHFDVIVIGSGPGGEGAAMQAVKRGLTVGMIEEYRQVGGNCTHKATIPSKALRHQAHRLTTFRTDPLFSPYLRDCNITFSQLMERAKVVMDSQVQLRTSHYVRNRVEVMRGHAYLYDANTVCLERKDGTHELLKAKNVVLATGSRPYRPKGIDFDHPRIFDSDTILQLTQQPRSLTIYGAGVIGCEYTSIFRALDCKVNLINTRDMLLSFLDSEIVDALSYHLRDQGVIIKHNESYETIEAQDDQVIVNLKSGKRVKSDIVLVAIGRKGNSDNLGLEELGIQCTDRGHVKVNEHYQTSIPNIYAVGDLTGFPSLASAAYDQGRCAASHILDPESEESVIQDVPVGIYTSPEISCIGRTEEELTRDAVPYEVGHVAFRHLARAQIIGQRVGMLKILFHCETKALLGIHCFGQNAAEIIHIGQAVMAQKGEANSLRYFTRTTFNYPTMAEAYRVAALNGLNRLCT